LPPLLSHECVQLPIPLPTGCGLLPVLLPPGTLPRIAVSPLASVRIQPTHFLQATRSAPAGSAQSLHRNFSTQSAPLNSAIRTQFDLPEDLSDSWKQARKDRVRPVFQSRHSLKDRPARLPPCPEFRSPE